MKVKTFFFQFDPDGELIVAFSFLFWRAVEDMIKEVDVDGDGRIDFDEFVYALGEPDSQDNDDSDDSDDSYTSPSPEPTPL